jgi:hypothetical protein
MQYRASITGKTEVSHLKSNPEDGKTERRLRGLVLLSYCRDRLTSSLIDYKLLNSFINGKNKYEYLF